MQEGRHLGARPRAALRVMVAARCQLAARRRVRGQWPAQSQRSHIGSASRSNHALPRSFTKVAWIARCGVMKERDPESEQEKPAALRSRAVELLQSAARQNDPREFDRLTRYALALIERARVRRHGLGGTPPRGTPVLREDSGRPKTQELQTQGKLRAKLIGALSRLRAPRER